MFNKEIANKIDDFIKEKFPIIYEYDFGGLVLTWGGSIRDTMFGENAKDLDFVILTQGECKIKDFIKKYNLKFKRNLFNNYKIFYNGITIDMFSTNDLMDATVYDTDMLFYDINIHQFISCGAIRAFEKRTITHINNDAKYVTSIREKKIIKFIKKLSNNNKKVKVKKNRVLLFFKSFVWKIEIMIYRLLNNNLIKCFRFLKKSKREFYLIVLLGIMVSTLSFVLPSVLGMMLSNLLDINYGKIITLIFIFFVIKLVILFLQFIFTKLYLVVNKSMVNTIRTEITDCILKLEMSNFNNNNSGVFIEKLKNDPREITRNFNSIKDLLVRGIGNFGLILYICFLDYRIGLLLFFFMILVFSIILKGVKKRKKYMREYYSNQEKYSSVLGEMLNGVGDIKKLDLKDNYAKMTISTFKNISEKEFEGNYYQRLYNKIASLVELMAIVVVFLVGVYLVKINLMEVSSLIIIFMYNSSVFTFVEKIGLLMELLGDLNVSCDRVFTLLNNDLYNDDVYGTLYKDKCVGKIEFSGVSFKYDDKNKEVLNNCSFKVGANECVSIVGKSGEGKTTILNLISRLYSNYAGVIKIDGIDINEYSEKYIRDNISVISQNPYLFDMSIKDNLKLVKEDITDEEVVSVCKSVCLDDFIESLPDKYDTFIGEGGVKLSGGQKQRLGIARALVKNTKIILLDEITSALDNETGTVIKKVINNIKKNHTVIVVTHELSMIKDSDRILVLSAGKILVDGKHKELIKDNETYQKLYKLK